MALWFAVVKRGTGAPFGYRPKMGDIQICNEVRALPGLLGDLNHIQSFIRRLSAPAEFCLVLSVGFGPFILAQPWALNHLPSAP